MGLERVATCKLTSALRPEAALLVVDGVKVAIEKADLAQFDTAEKVKAELARQAATSQVKMPAIFVHINRDSSLALATEAEPETWPENEREEEQNLG